MAILNKKDILGIKDEELNELDVPEWGGSVCVGTMTVKERLDFEEKYCDVDGSFFNIKDPALTFDLLALVLKTSEGEKLFNKEDIVLLGDKNAKVVGNIFNYALNINYQTKSSVDKVKKN